MSKTDIFRTIADLGLLTLALFLLSKAVLAVFKTIRNEE